MCGKHFGDESKEVEVLKQIKLYETLPSLSGTLETSESGADILSRSTTVGKQSFENMWEFVQKAHEYQGQEFIFKSKHPKKRYIQVIAQSVANNQKTIIFCTDITRVKQAELQEQRMRATFFSSVAHELRTPLNSISPIVKMIIELFKK